MNSRLSYIDMIRDEHLRAMYPEVFKPGDPIDHERLAEHIEAKYQARLRQEKKAQRINSVKLAIGYALIGVGLSMALFPHAWVTILGLGK